MNISFKQYLVEVEKTQVIDFANMLAQLNEMPMTNMTFQGSWGPKAKGEFGYNRQDLGILENPNATEKIMRKWSNTKENFEVHFVRSEKGSAMYPFSGEVSKEWVKKNLDFDVQPQPDTITVIFTQNIGAEKVPMTAWTVGHRFGHAIFNVKEFDIQFYEKIKKDFITFLHNVYGVGGEFRGDLTFVKNVDYPYYASLLDSFAKQIGTMSSARNKKLLNFGEFVFELVAQYVVTGKIEFNPLPRKFIITNKDNLERHEEVKINDEKFEKYNKILENYAKFLEKRLDKIFSSLRNKIFVM
jgi:hypothetical protein